MNVPNNQRDEDLPLGDDLLSFEAELRSLKPSPIRFELDSSRLEPPSVLGKSSVSAKWSQWAFASGCLAGMAAGIAATLLATNLFTTPVGPIPSIEGPSLAVNQPRSIENESVKSKEPAKGVPSSESEQSKARDIENDYLANTPRIWLWLSRLPAIDSNQSVAKTDPNQLHIVRAKLDPSNWRDREWLNEWIEPWAFKPSASAYSNNDIPQTPQYPSPSSDVSGEESTKASLPKSPFSPSLSPTPESQTPETRPGQHQLMRSWLNESERFSG